ncbi:SnoaL-like domain-containing protein [Pilibacter termitis]|uniref:SnoaL-like domain-containing protein n=1 Tax=Pilibacter termitis TaxID=263852 RepID=A0A1T4LYD4_9ENTE|nr:nuclear transport factor 2 family protein [Pilibacter termitis]SJZ59675.1 SnoaL-like domain-containing protein [Pilibacter termitis]
MKNIEKIIFPDIHTEVSQCCFYLKEENAQKDEDILNEYISSINSHDFENVRKILSPNAEFIFSDKKCSKIEDIEEYFIKAWEELSDEVYEAKNSKILIENEYLKIFTYNFYYYGTNTVGEAISGNGEATNIFSKINNEWKLIHEHLSCY